MLINVLEREHVDAHEQECLELIFVHIACGNEIKKKKLKIQQKKDKKLEKNKKKQHLIQHLIFCLKFPKTRHKKKKKITKNKIALLTLKAFFLTLFEKR